MRDSESTSTSPAKVELIGSEQARNPAAEFTIVGIGASAGGVEACSQLLGSLPPDSGLAFILVQHLSANHKSMLASVIGTSTKMAVLEAAHDVQVRPNHVYVIPPNTELTIDRGTLKLAPRPQGPQPHMAIDSFFQALAEEEQTRTAIGVLLSGTGSDGTEGLRAIKASGGVTFAQTPESARFGRMPLSAVQAGVADHVLTPENIAAEIMQIVQHAARIKLPSPAPQSGTADDDAELRRILTVVRERSGLDFTGYKYTTVKRRLSRRMILRRVDTLEKYMAMLRIDADEAFALSRDILVHVTGFFRDSEPFAALQNVVIPEIVRRHADGSTIRIWVPGCSTGEEVYSIAILLHEALSLPGARIGVQIFASDLSEEAITYARAGTYKEAGLQNVTAERLSRYFTLVHGEYRIVKEIRDLCIFSRHDVTRDPPLARLDLVSCRNMLIYFGPALQKRVLPLFHYCLNPGGFLFLGNAESVGGASDAFEPVDASNRIFTKVGTTRGFGMNLARLPAAISEQDGPWSPAEPADPIVLRKHAENMLVARYALPALMINERAEVVQVLGKTGPFVEMASGQPNLSMWRLARSELVPDLRVAFQRALKEQRVVRRDGIIVGQNGASFLVNLIVEPLSGAPGDERFFLVVFEKSTLPVLSIPNDRHLSQNADLTQLQEEMATTREYLESLLDERQRINDELTSRSEEILSGNEELQSTVEEMETAKEEMQSTNEELSTVNDELNRRNKQLDSANGDLVNLLASTDIPIIIIGGDRLVRRFTPRAKTLMNLIPADIGRSIDDIKLNVNVPNFDELIAEVLDTVSMKESQVQDRQGRWYRMRIRPYLTVDQKIDGIVLSLTDIDDLKRTVDRAEESLTHVKAIVETVNVPLVVLNRELRVLSANAAYFASYGAAPSDVRDHDFFAAPAWNVGGLRDAVVSLSTDQAVCEMEIVVKLPNGAEKLVAVSGRTLPWLTAESLILLSLIDITERAKLLSSARHAQHAAEQSNAAKDQFLATLSHELRTPLSAILLRATMLQSKNLTLQKAHNMGQVIEAAARIQSQLVEDLLDISRIVSGKMSIACQSVNLADIVQAAVDTIAAAAEAKSIEVNVRIDRSTGLIWGDAVRFQQVVWNLITNAIKFTPEHGKVSVSYECIADMGHVQVTDNGAGIAADFLPHLFTRFAQADGTSTRRHGGLGLGLAIVYDLVRLHGGTVLAESPGVGHGSTFTLNLPLLKSAKTVEGHQDDAATDENAETAEPELKGIKVLLIEDDRNTREALHDILDAHEVDIRVASSGSEGLAAFADFAPHVLLCDINMPIEDGYSVIKKIRILEGGQIPAAALTALASADDQKQSLKAGFQLHLSKPISERSVCDAVAMLARLGAQAALQSEPGFLRPQ